MPLPRSRQYARSISHSSRIGPFRISTTRSLAGLTGTVLAVAGFATYQAVLLPRPASVLHADARPQSQNVDNEKSTPFFSTPSSGDGKDDPTGALTSTWVANLPSLLAKLQRDIALVPGTLASEIWEDAHNPQIHPEVTRPAFVRVSDQLCDEEEAFKEKRKRYTKEALAKYLGLNEEDVHPDDVPVIAMCGSGGGLRALVAGAASYYAAQKAGLFDCVTYTAGVSGSCWLQTLYHSHITGQRFDKLLDHLKDRLGTHIAFPPPALKLLATKPSNKFLLAGALEKFHGLPDADYGLVDAYGLLLAARLLLPKNELDLDAKDLKLSEQRRYIDSGKHPMPIYTAVRHEITEEAKPASGGFGVQELAVRAAREKTRHESWFQWFELTAYEIFAEELGAGIPTWASGREFRNGQTLWREGGTALPEIRITMLMGIWGSAFCATLSHYYKEVRPLVQAFTALGGLDQMIHSRDDDLAKVHPIDPAQMPNYVFGMKGVLPKTCPESLGEAKTIDLADAGMSNNLPIYPLLRPGRDVDIIIAFDASADIKKDNWLKVTDGYARQRGIRGWPIGIGWPEDEAAPVAKAGEAMAEAGALSPGQSDKHVENAVQDQDQQAGRSQAQQIGQGTVWVGSQQERVSEDEPPPSKQVQEDWELMKPDAGVTVVYFPFLKNDKVEGVDPLTSEFMSTWNFVYTPENVDQVTRLAEANFAEGEERTKMAVRAVYERKRRRRLEQEEKEKQERQNRWKLPLKEQTA